MGIWHRLLNHWKGSNRTPTSARRPPLHLEALENRTMPTALVKPWPAFGPEAQAQPNGAALSSPPVFFTYWGSYWGSATGTQAANVYAAAYRVLSGTYLQAVQQYGSDGKAFLDPARGYDGTNPAAGFSGDRLKEVVTHQITDGPLPRSTTPAHTPIYVVVTPPGIRSAKASAGGYNTRIGWDGGDLPTIWIGTNPVSATDNSINIDSFTLTLSHEMAEIMSDYGNGGFKVVPPAGWTAAGGQGDDQIGDLEGNSYTYRLGNGALVQPLWSKNDQQWLVTDGNKQIMQLSPVSWTLGGNFGFIRIPPRFSGTYDLTINTDQRPGITRDFVELNSSTLGSTPVLWVNFNGEYFYFDANRINNVTINSTRGSDLVVLNGAPGVQKITINQGSALRSSDLTVIAKVPATIVQRSLLPSTLTVTAQAPVTVNGVSGSITIANQSTTTVNAAAANSVFVRENTGGGLLTISNAGAVVLGSTGLVSSFTARTSIQDTTGTTALTVDDSADTTARAFTLSPTSLNGLTANAISFVLANLSSFTLNGGSGGNLVTVSGSPFRIDSVLNSGSGADYVSVQRTSGTLTVNGQNGRDTVVVGENGSVQGVTGTLTVTNAGNFSTLSLDDTANPTSRTVTLDVGPTYGTITGLAPALIQYRKGAVRALSVSAGTGSDSFTINDTILTNFRLGTMTTLNTGGGGHSIAVNGSTGPLTINAQGSFNGITVGSTKVGLNQINGALYISGPTALNYLSVNDAASTTSHSYVVDHDSVQRDDKPQINYQDIFSLSLTAGSQTDQITVRDTLPAGFGGGTTINTGGGDDPIYVHRTTGALFLNAGGFSYIEVFPSLDAIQGTIQINAAAQATNFVTLSLEDRQATTAQQLDINASAFGASFQRSGAAFISVIFSQLGSFQWISGSGGTTINMRGRPAQSSNFILANDVLNIGTRAGTISNFGAISVTGGPGFDSVNMNDSGEARPQNYDVSVVFGRDSIATRGTTVTVDSGVEAVDLAGGSGGNLLSVTGTIPGTALTVNAGSGDDTANVGSSSNTLDTIAGPVTIEGGAGSDTLNLNDRGAAVNRVVTVYPDRVILPNLNAVGYGDIANLNIFSGSGDDILGVVGTAAGTTTNLFGGDGNDEFSIAGVDSTLDGLLGPLNLHGEGGIGNFIQASDYSNPTPQVFTLTADALIRTGIAPITFDPMNQVILYAGGRGTSINVLSVAPGTFETIASRSGDTTTIGSNAPGLGGTLADVQGDVRVQTSDTEAADVIIDDSGDLQAHPQVTFDNDGFLPVITGLAPQRIYYQLGAGANLQILGGQADDTFSIKQVDANVNVAIDGGGGVNTLDYSAHSGLPGLVAWYPGEGNADDVSGGNNGILHGDVTFAPGKVGQAFSFNGVDSFVQVPNSPYLQPVNVSVEAWVNSTELGRNKYILAKGADGDAAASYALYTAETGLRFYVYDGVTFGESPDPGPGIWDGNWHHVVGTYDGTSVRLYVDGAEVGTGTPALLQIRYGLPTANDLFIGTYGTTNSVYDFSGLVDEPSVYNRALSAAEVQKLFAAGSGGKSAAATGVVVNLPLGMATDLRGGIANIQNVVGSSFNDILVGNGGNVLDGGDGNDLLIAGASASTLLGGRGDDLLIAGTTIYDVDPPSLDAILAAWTQPDQDYATRVATLRNGLLTDDAFTPNNGANVLSGGDGLDLFFAGFNDLGDWTPDEIVVRK